jgi:hypothetical protein
VDSNRPSDFIYERGAGNEAKRMAEKLVRWLVFSVIFALLPLAFNYLRISIRGTAPTLALLLSRGELLLVCAAIAATAIGELIGSGGERKIAKYVAGGGCVFVLFLASALFAEISTAIYSGAPVNSEFVSNSSIFVFGFTLISSTSCIVLVESKE